ncbi:MAG: hypothetical protein JXL97_07140 [Bacteroidales bacterium]|nr:hypothetical protein [Bacteroidales bacterium]
MMTYFLHIKDNQAIEEQFINIAAKLLLESQLQVNSVFFNFTEIEFYFYDSRRHQDVFTHRHEMEAGRWRFHNQGFDITLKGENGFGGILIRGVENTLNQQNRFINGPRRVLFEITKYFNQINIPNNIFTIVDKPVEEFEIFQTFRHGLNNPVLNEACNDIVKYRNSPYRFIIKPTLFDKKQFAGAESIAKSFQNRQRIYDFLGYNLEF